ncbi:MAG: hypothetical protein ABI977_15235 [Acidobacteriota bacterium]
MSYTHRHTIHVSNFKSMIKLIKSQHLVSLAVLISAAVLAAGPGAQLMRSAKAMATLTVCSVGCSSTTINGAITLANPGDTISVAPGTYNEIVLVNKANLTINGANAGVNACSGTRGAESIVNNTGGGFAITANGSSINGFTVQGVTGLPFNSGIFIANTVTGAQILNNIVQNNVIGISPSGSNILIQGNNIRDNNNPGAASGSGIYTDAGLTNSTINNNCFSNNQNVSTNIIGAPCFGSAITGNSVTNNTVTSGGPFYFLGGTNLTITGNTHTGGSSHAVQIDGGVNGATIRNNNFANGAFSAIRISNFNCVTPNQNIVANCNRLVNFGDDAIRLSAGAYTGPLNAENNFYGCNAGPGTAGCETITDPDGVTDSTPFLVLTLAANSNSVFTGQTSTLTASLNTNSVGAAAGCGINGAPVAFASTCGTVNPAATTTVGGTANSTLTASATTGSCTASATVDNQTVTVPLAVNIRPTATIVDPFGCTGPGDVLNVTLTLTNAAAVTQTVAATATLPAGLPAVAGSCTTNVPAVTCTVVNGTTVAVAGTLTAGQAVTVTYQAQIGDVTPSTTLTINTVASFGGGATITVSASTVVNCPAAGPGLPYPATSEVSDQKAGSVLYYNLYTSGSSPTTQNTRISLTNTNTTVGIAVHLFFVDGTSCSVADANICLTPNQTSTFLASDLDPGTTGYIVAVASDSVTGCPINFNFLIGDEYVKLTSGHAANLGAEAFAAIAGGLSLCNTNSTTAQLNFDGISYNRAPRVLAIDNVPSRADGNDTLLVINRVGGNLATGAATLINLFGIFYDDSEVALSFGFGGASSSPGTCQFRSSLSNSFPRLTPRFDQFIPAGRSGWAKIYSQADIGLLGAVLNTNPNAGTAANAFEQGHNLHKLTLTPTASLTIPIFPPGCGF